MNSDPLFDEFYSANFVDLTDVAFCEVTYEKTSNSIEFVNIEIMLDDNSYIPKNQYNGAKRTSKNIGGIIIEYPRTFSEEELLFAAVIVRLFFPDEFNLMEK